GPVLDAGLIAACQKVEHYEIAGYGTLIAMAKHLGLDDAASLLGETLEEEKSADQKLTAIAEEGGTQAATMDLEDQDSEDDQEQEKQGRQKKRQA
ncbi:YciE/YciF ferroxidase family protein, partial [Pseudomonas syringae]|uniref:YciE/YciF ferroxidase family protein n=2 Tax=Pseudomonas TaxID=286 RepID=UPI0011AF654B